MLKNTAGQKIGAQMISATDGSEFTGSVTVYVTIDAGTQGAGSVGSGACAHEGHGYHTYAPAAAETNGNLLAFTFVGTGAVTATVQVFTVDNGISRLLDTVNTGATHNVGNSVGSQIRSASTVPSVILASGTCRGGASNTITLATTASAIDGVYYPNTISITGGTGAGQTRSIIAYNGTTKVATVDKAWTVNPVNASSTYQIVASTRSIASFEGVATAGGNSTVTLPTTASASDDFYAGIVAIESGTGAGQWADITDYTGSSREVSIAPATWSANPDSTSVVAIIPSGGNAGDAGGVAPTTDQIIAAMNADPPKVDVDTIKTQAVTCVAGVTINVNVGTTEPVNFTDTGASAKVNAQIQASDDIDFTATQKATMSTTVGTAQTGDSYAEVTNATYGLSALNTKVGTPADTDVSTDIANVALELAKVPKSDSNVTFNATALGDIKTQAVAALNTDTYAEPGQEAPAATNTLVKKIGYLFKAWRNLATQTATDYKLYNDAGAVVDQKATTSDDGTTFTRTEIGTGP